LEDLVTSVWAFAAMITIVLGSVVRELVGLRRLAMRHEAIARLAEQAVPGTVIQDSDTATRVTVGGGPSV
jgi:uncharacterized membrane protein YcjF (UPF0283 family)